MNKQLIEQLARKALETKVDERVWTFSTTHLNQFSSLIVQECLKVLHKTAVAPTLVDEWDRAWHGGVVSGLELVEEHFGVKYEPE